MSPRWERRDAPLAVDSPLIDAVITPHRSLSGQSFLLVLSSFALMNLGVAIVFWLHGAYPVSGFMGLDVVGLALAFHLNRRTGRARERVLVSPESVQVMRMPPGRAEICWAASPLWVQVHDDPRAVRISASGRDLYVGGFLSPPERHSLAAALRAAVFRARR